MDSKMKKLRLGSSFAVSSMIVLFIWQYSLMAAIRFQALFPGGHGINGCRFLERFSVWFFMVPICGLMAGRLAIALKRDFLFEMVMQVQKLMIIGLFLFTLLMWLVQEVPRTSPRGYIW